MSNNCKICFDIKKVGETLMALIMNRIVLSKILHYFERKKRKKFDITHRSCMDAEFSGKYRRSTVRRILTMPMETMQ